MKLSPEDAVTFLDSALEAKVSLTPFEIDFIKSCVRISKSKGMITLSKGQTQVFDEIHLKIKLHKLEGLVDASEPKLDP